MMNNLALEIFNEKGIPSNILIFNGLSQYDPTRTLTLRNNFSKAIVRRFKELQRVIKISIVNNDCFGLKKSRNSGFGIFSNMSPAGVKQFNFPRSQDKLVGFQDWLSKQMNEGILEISESQQLGEAIESAWTNQYIDSAYQQGIVRGRQELINAGYDITPMSQEIGGVQAVFNQPFHLDRVGVIYTRTYSQLKNITQQMDAEISDVLAKGLAEGLNPTNIAYKLNKKVKVGMARARTIARTEVINAHHKANVQEYKNAGALGVKVKAEFKTAGDSRVCSKCKSLDGKIFTLKEVENKIPVHPNCRCLALPLDVTDQEKVKPIKKKPVVVKDKVKPIKKESVTPRKKKIKKEKIKEKITSSKVTDNFSKKEYKDLLQGLTNRRIDEGEFILTGGNKTFALKDVMYGE